MAQDRATLTREKLIRATTELIRKQGYVATSIDDICESSGVTKGALFHHYKTKEELTQACIEAWDQGVRAMIVNAPFQALPSPRERVLGFMDFFVERLSDPQVLKSCLVGTTVQEVASTNPVLRDAAATCFSNLHAGLKAMLDAAHDKDSTPVDTAALASLWIATLQGALILTKATGDASVISTTLSHVKHYIASILPAQIEPKEK